MKNYTDLNQSLQGCLYIRILSYARFLNSSIGCFQFYFDGVTCASHQAQFTASIPEYQKNMFASEKPV